jgi:glycosyltransferase involved in cell wall biosynthesis
MGILLIYSERHFNPHDGSVEMRTTGTGYWAKWFYEELSKVGQVEYVDLNRPELIPSLKSIGLIVGLNSRSFSKAMSLFPEAFRILVCVNSHPLFRNSALLHEADHYRVALSNEIVNPFRQLGNIAFADKIVVTGNARVARTYLQWGVRRSDLTRIQGVPDSSFFKASTSQQSRKPLSILYPAGDIGLRKGVLRFFDCLPTLMRRGLHFSLTIVGERNSVIDNLLDDILHRYASVSVVGWLPHEQYVDLMSRHHFVLLLSLEEGQVFSVMEAMLCGCVPLVSRNCGLSFPEAFTIKDPFDIQEIAHKLLRLASGSFDAESKGLLTRISEDANRVKLMKILYSAA